MPRVVVVVCCAAQSGGAIKSYGGPVVVVGSSFSNGLSTAPCGAICSKVDVSITSSTFYNISTPVRPVMDCDAAPPSRCKQPRRVTTPCATRAFCELRVAFC